MTLQRRVLFLGAGASSPFGVPVTAEILPEILRRQADGALFRDRASGTRRAPREPSAELQDLLSRFLPGLMEQAVEPPLITDLLSLLDQLLFTGNALAPSFGPAELDRLRDLMEQALAEVLSEPGRGEGPQQNAPLLECFAAWIEGVTARGDGVTIISTNYDVVIEKELYERFGREKLAEQIDFGLAWRPSSEHGPGPLRPRPASPLLAVYKLHGSLDWLRCPLCDFIYIDPSRALAPAGREEGRPPRTCACGYAALRHLIVAPSMVRQIRDPSLLSLWQSALEALRTADEWIIIGYSMPPEDVAIRALLLRAYRGRAKPPAVRLVDLGHEEVERRYRLLFPELQVDAGGLEGFVALASAD